ncbi:MAG: CCA tRNA nucleotidyltransferase, partial [Chloroflexi bacterium]|nr:CCA tRNA nucleotidyltransferase [Chloroflexota bacterium]
IDLAMARKETYAYPGALPSVSPASIDEDLARRDFSINAMAVSLSPDTWGDLLDPFDGQGDLQRRLIKVLHPESFVDDATRILRAVRYVGRLGFQIEASTEQFLKRDISYLDTIKGDRVRHELERISYEERVESILKLAQDFGVLRAIHPALYLQNSTLKSLGELNAEETSDSGLLFLSLLTYAAASDERPALIKRLNMDSRLAGVVRDTGSAKDSYDRLDNPELRRSQLHELLSPFAVSAIKGCSLAADNPVVARHLNLFLSELRHVKPFLNGDDLIAMGVPEGPVIGKLLKAILASKLDGLIATEEDETNFVNRNL